MVRQAHTHGVQEPLRSHERIKSAFPLVDKRLNHQRLLSRTGHDRTAAGTRGAGCAALPCQYHISIGTPAEAIAQYAQEQGADQIVMGRQGQGGLQSLLLGSVVNKVPHLAECPVLLVKQE